MAVARAQRWTRANPCPICGGYDQAERGAGRRCFGFLSSDGAYAHCTREEVAGGLPLGDESQTYAHRLTGDCRCGRSHGPAASSPPGPRGSRIVATYPYRDERGELLFEVVRFDPKSFRQRRPHPTRPGEWLWSLDGCRRVPYRLPELRAAVAAGRRVHVVEGEKDADAAVALGLDATTFPGGAGKFRPEYAESFRGAHVVIHPDDDEAGRRHAAQVRAALAPVVASLKVVPLPGAKDLAAWRDAGGTLEQLEALVAAAPTDGPLAVPAADLEAPAVSDLVEGLLLMAMLGILSGRDKRGKTLLALEIVACVLTGAPLFGRFPVRRGRVLACLLDDPLSVTLGRLAALGVRRHPGLYLVDPLRLGDDPLAFLARLEAEALRLKPVLIVVDALYLFVPTSKDAGNDASRMLPVMRALDRLAIVTGAAVLLIAHDSKSGADVAGSFVVRAMAKTIMRLTLPPAEESAAGDGEPVTARRLLSVESKLRAAAVHVLENRGPGAWTYLGESGAVREADLETAVLDRLADGEPHTAAELGKALGRREDTVRAALGRLEQAGRVEAGVRSGPRGGRPARHYWRVEVSPAGETRGN